MARKIILSAPARHDLRALIQHIAQDAPARAEAFAHRLVQATRQAGDFPESGRIVPEYGQGELRELIVPPIRIIYRVRPDQIEVIRFWHAARGTPQLPS